MEIKTIKVGELETNCYILENNNSTIIIDPGDNPELIKANIQSKIEAILITHHHPDHVGALKYFDASVYDINNINTFKSDNFKISYIETKGHTLDSVTYIIDNILFTGDFLFKDTIGRCDFYNSSYKEMLESIKKIKAYKGYLVYPGHGDKTNIDDEIKYNPYFNLVDTK